MFPEPAHSDLYPNPPPPPPPPGVSSLNSDTSSVWVQSQFELVLKLCSQLWHRNMRCNAVTVQVACFMACMLCKQLLDLLTLILTETLKTGFLPCRGFASCPTAANLPSQLRLHPRGDGKP